MGTIIRNGHPHFAPQVHKNGDSDQPIADSPSAPAQATQGTDETSGTPQAGDKPLTGDDSFGPIQPIAGDQTPHVLNSPPPVPQDAAPGNPTITARQTVVTLSMLHDVSDLQSTLNQIKQDKSKDKKAEIDDTTSHAGSLHPQRDALTTQLGGAFGQPNASGTDLALSVVKEVQPDDGAGGGTAHALHSDRDRANGTDSAAQDAAATAALQNAALTAQQHVTQSFSTDLDASPTRRLS